MQNKKIIIFMIIIFANLWSLIYLLIHGIENINQDLLGQLSWFILIISIITAHFIWGYVGKNVVNLKSNIVEFNMKFNYVLDKAIESKYRWLYLFLFFLFEFLYLQFVYFK